jgi:hypothetical protein
MKKIFVLVLIIIITFIITACGDAQGAGVQGTPEPSISQNGYEQPGSGTNSSMPDNGADPNDNGEQASTGFSFTFNDVVIKMDDDIDYIIGKIGEPRGDFHVPSCAFDGYDRIVEYPGIQITAYPSGESHRIFNLSFLDDSIRTTEGRIRLDSPVQAVFDAYGEDYSYETGMYRFTRGLTYLEFLTEDGHVIRITYRLDLGL